MRAVLAVALVLTCASSALAQVRISLEVDRTELSLDEVLTLQIQVESEGHAAPEIQAPDFNGFEVVQQRVSRPMQFSFSFGGQQQVVKSSANYQFVLQPLAPGRYTLGPAQVQAGGQRIQSRSVQITVHGALGQGPNAQPAAPDQAAEPAEPAAPVRATDDGLLDGAVVEEQGFLRTVVSKGKPFEGEQLTVTQYLYMPERLQSPPRIVKEASTDGLWTHDLLDPQRQLDSVTQNVRGRLYRAYVLRRFAAFALRSGELTIGPMQVEVDRSNVFDLFGRGRARGNLNLSGVPLTLDVKPLPSEGKPAGEIAVGRYTVSAAVDRTETVTGEAVKLTAKVEGQGNLRTIALAEPVLVGADVLQPQVRDLAQVEDGVLQGTRQFEWLLVPKEPGELTIPALVLQSFDPHAQRYVELRSTPITLRVAGNALPPATALPPPTDASSAPARTDATTPREVPTERWPTLRTHSALVRSTPRVVSETWFVALLALGPMLWIGVVLVDVVRRRLAARATLDGPERSRQRVQQRLAEAERAARGGDAPVLHAACAAALHEQLSARLGESTLGVSRAQLKRMLEQSGMAAALANDVLGQLDRADVARFGAAADAGAGLGEEYARVKALLARVNSSGAAT